METKRVLITSPVRYRPKGAPRQDLPVGKTVDLPADVVPALLAAGAAKVAERAESQPATAGKGK